MNDIHSTAVIGPLVQMGQGNVVGPFSVIVGDVSLGDDNWIGPHVCIGTPGEVYAVEHPAAWNGGPGTAPVAIGSSNVIREFVAIQAGPYGPTLIRDGCYLMSKSHVNHDCVLESRVTLSTGATLAGHARLGAGANLGLNATVHQRVVIGPGAMLGMCAVVTRDVPPHAKAFGSPARVRGVNRVGMTRSGYADSEISLWEQQLCGAADREWQVPEALRPDVDWWVAATRRDR